MNPLTCFPIEHYFTPRLMKMKLYKAIIRDLRGGMTPHEGTSEPRMCGFFHQARGVYRFIFAEDEAHVPHWKRTVSAHVHSNNYALLPGRDSLDLWSPELVVLGFFKATLVFIKGAGSTVFI